MEISGPDYLFSIILASASSTGNPTQGEHREERTTLGNCARHIGAPGRKTAPVPPEHNGQLLGCFFFFFFREKNLFIFPGE